MSPLAEVPHEFESGRPDGPAVGSADPRSPRLLPGQAPPRETSPGASARTYGSEARLRRASRASCAAPGIRPSPNAKTALPHLSVRTAFVSFRSRDGRIRTGDPLNPIQVRYRAAPRPEKTNAEYNPGGWGHSTGRAVDSGLEASGRWHRGKDRNPVDTISGRI